MDANQLLHENFKEFELHGVLNTEQELQRGPHSAVVELEFHGLKCAGMKISRKFYEEATVSERSKIWQKLEQECRTMSCLRHPNIVQFMGVLYSQPLPIVVTEYLPTTLNNHLRTSGVLPNPASYSVLEDVATALCYLHAHQPTPLVHGSLTADNVLLTANNSCAKIAYLGEAKILGLKSAVFEQTLLPPACLPPASVGTDDQNQQQSYKTDVFSFGSLVVHTFSGRYPSPPENCQQDQVEFALQQIPERHPLASIVKQCLCVAEPVLPKAADILDYIRCVRFQLNNNADNCTAVVHRDPEVPPQENITDPGSQQALREEQRLTAGIERSFETFRAEAESIDVTELKLKNEHLEKKVIKLSDALDSKRITIEAKNNTIQKLIEKEEQQQDAIVDFKLQQEELLLKDQLIRMKQKRIQNFESTLAAISSDMPHPLNMKCRLSWRESIMLPFGITAPQHVVIGSTIYVGGGQTDSDDDKRMVLRYCTDSIKWDILPPSPFMHFGLGQYEDQLITVGGSCEDDDATVTAEVMHFNNTSKTWARLLAPMPTARRRACVVSHQASLAVCGGIEGDGRVSSVVEVFRQQQWHTASPLPKPRAAMGVALRGDTVYLTGGYFPTLKLQKYAQRDCQYVSLPSLLENQAAKWELLTALPVISTMVISHCGTLMAVGGLDSSQPQPTKSDAVYAYSDPLKQWVQVDRLPFKCSSMMVASVYSNEIYIIGGWQEKNRSKRVMIGTYSVK